MKNVGAVKKLGTVKKVMAVNREVCPIIAHSKNGGFVTFYIVGTVKKVKTVKKVGTVGNHIDVIVYAMYITY